MALCTLHEETTPSMSLVKYPDGSWGYRCFGCGATGDSIKYVQATRGLDFQDAVKLLAKEANEAPMKPTIAATYDYTDRDGKLLYQVVRYSPKGFRQRVPTEHGWSWCLNGVSRVLYRLHKLASANPSETVYYVEGEKDVQTLEQAGLLATTHSGGANSFRPDLLGQIEGTRRIVVVPDNDEPGKNLMRDVYREARKRGHDVHFLLLPETGKDSTEFFEHGGTLEQFLGLVK